MIQKRIIPLIVIFILIILCRGYAFYGWNERPYEFTNCRYSDEEYNFSIYPPHNAELCTLTCISYSMNVDYDFGMHTDKIPIAKIGNSVYFQMIPLKIRHKSASVSTWIRAVKEGNTLRFKNEEFVGTVKYDLEGSYFDGDITWDFDSILRIQDSIKMNTVTIGNQQIIHGFDGWVHSYESIWPISFAPTSEDLRVDYNSQTGLVHSPTHHILIESDYSKKYVPHHVTNDIPDSCITDKDFRDQMAIRDFIIGKVSHECPPSLPVPRIKKYTSSTEFFNISLGVSHELSLILDNGYLIDHTKLHTVYYKNGKVKLNLSSLDGFSPFPNNLIYTPLDVIKDGDIFEGMYYYQCDDGSRIESPRLTFHSPGYQDCQYSDVTYNWDAYPPEDAEPMTLTYIYNYWLPDSAKVQDCDFQIGMTDIEGAKHGKDIYYRLAFLRENSENNRDTVKGWVAARWENDIIRFFNNRKLGTVNYDMHALKKGALSEENCFQSFCDTIRMQSVTFGPNIQLDRYLSHTTGETPCLQREKAWEYEKCNEDILARYYAGTDLVYGNNHHLLINSDYSRNYTPVHIGWIRYKNFVSSRDLRDEIGVKDFIIGRLCERPDPLPLPEVKAEKRVVRDKGEDSMEKALANREVICHVVHPLMTEDGYLVDPRRMHTVYLVNGEEIADYESFEGFSPFQSAPKEINMGHYDKDWVYELMCYYEYDDGTRIESARINVFDPTEIELIKEEGPKNFEIESKVYDLTGREVNGEHLTPGIYIRNRQKFVVR